MARVPGVVNAISGLGYAFTGQDRMASVYRRVATVAYRSALRGESAVTIFQNEDDRRYFTGSGLVRSDRTALIRGSGVDLHAFRPRPKHDGSCPVVLYAGRMLWSKGVGDLVEAARRLRAAGHEFRAELVGHSDADNPEAIPQEQLVAWTDEGIVTWRGRQTDMPRVMAGADIVVLGSERGGVPKVLLEAAGAGLPIVATNVPGCREVVDHGSNGFLVPVHDPDALAGRLSELLTDAGMRERMGAASRSKAVDEFSEQMVAEQTLELYRKVLAARAS
jgi:glycosyltransferase involved in cell wall biosynthesis